MREIIRKGEVVSDALVHLEDDAPLVAGDVTVSLSRWLAEAGALTAHDAQVGVRLAPTDDARALAEQAASLPLIAVEFPKFSDGRGYSHARILREQLGFKGELRAVGDVLRDQLFVMARCGFDAFEVRADKDIRDALKAFETFSVRYQGAADDPRPVFRQAHQSDEVAA